MRRPGALVLLLWLVAGLGEAAPSRTLCTPSETTYFSCTASKGRTIAICGNAGSSLQYRFGRSGAVELQFPDDASTGAARMFFSHYSRYRTDRTEIRFENRGSDYAVFDHDEEDGKRSAGVRVTTSDEKEHQILCAGPVESKLPALKGVLKCDADSALNLGSCP